MKVTGREAKDVLIDVRASDIIRDIRNKWLTRTGMWGDYVFINDDGIWESWEDTCHGSGVKVYGRRATQLELEQYEAFLIILSLVEREQY